MLSSITPLGERARGQHWGLTAAALTLGHLLGGALLGLLLTGLGTAIRPAFGGSLPLTAQLAVVGCVSVGAAVFDISGRSLPGHRQVDETWLTSYRGWVYGFGFGVQLGLGFVTVINTALFVPVVVAGLVLVPPTAIALGAGYGGIRAAMALANARVHTVDDLKGLHRRLDAVGDVVRIVSASIVGLLGAAAVIAAGGASA